MAELEITTTGEVLHAHLPVGHVTWRGRFAGPTYAGEYSTFGPTCEHCAATDEEKEELEEEVSDLEWQITKLHRDIEDLKTENAKLKAAAK